MKSKLLSISFLSGALLLSGQVDSFGQGEFYLADVQTVVSAQNTQFTNRLYRSAGTLAPTNTTLWFVADTALNGVPTNPPANQILGPDDVLIHVDVVDGQIFGNQPGRYRYFGLGVTNIAS